MARSTGWRLRRTDLQLAWKGISTRFDKSSYPPPVTFEVTGHDITISKAGSNAFSVKEKVKYAVSMLPKDCASYALWFLNPLGEADSADIGDVLCDEYPLGSENAYDYSTATMGRGIVLREVNIQPITSILITLPAPQFSKKSVPMTFPFRSDVIEQVPVPSGPRRWSFDLNGGKTIKVVIEGMPQNSFYQAKGAPDLKKSPYLGQEEVRWSINDLDQDVKFAFIPTPYHHIRPILSPVLDMASLSKWLIGITGFLGTTGLTLVARPVLFRPATARVDSWLKGRRKRHPVETVTLYVSRDGEEREVEVRRPKRG